MEKKRALSKEEKKNNLILCRFAAHTDLKDARKEFAEQLDDRTVLDQAAIEEATKVLTRHYPGLIDVAVDPGAFLPTDQLGSESGFIVILGGCGGGGGGCNNVTTGDDCGGGTLKNDCDNRLQHSCTGHSCDEVENTCNVRKFGCKRVTSSYMVGLENLWQEFYSKLAQVTQYDFTWVEQRVVMFRRMPLDWLL